LPRSFTAVYTPPVPADITLIVSDAHLGFAPRDVEEAFHRFLDTVPDRCDHLIVNGDLFEFWFEYGTVVPSAHFATLERLARVRDAGVRLTLTGGNHDRWGGRFWREQMRAEFHSNGTELRLGGRLTRVAHGDEVEDLRPSARVLHGLLRMRVTAAAFRWLHPDVGIGAVRALGGVLSDKERSTETVSAAAAHQERFAREQMAARPELELLVLGHTHRPALVQVQPGRWYLNPGAWQDGLRYATVSAEGPKLEVFEE
jgi:UDP-2,3-diacylglucosamine hydrolase